MFHCKSVQNPVENDKNQPDNQPDEGYSSINILQYQNLVWLIFILSTKTRPDISFYVNLLFRHSSEPVRVNMVA